MSVDDTAFFDAGYIRFFTVTQLPHVTMAVPNIRHTRSSDSAGEVKSESMPQISADGGCRELDVNDGCSRSRETPSGTPRQNRPPAKAERQNFGQLRDHIIPEKGKADDNEATEDVVERERAEEMAAEWPRPSKRFGKRKNILQEKVGLRRESWICPETRGKI